MGDVLVNGGSQLRHAGEYARAQSMGIQDERDRRFRPSCPVIPANVTDKSVGLAVAAGLDCPLCKAESYVKRQSFLRLAHNCARSSYSLA